MSFDYELSENWKETIKHGETIYYSHSIVNHRMEDGICVIGVHACKPPLEYKAIVQAMRIASEYDKVIVKAINTTDNTKRFLGKIGFRYHNETQAYSKGF